LFLHHNTTFQPYFQPPEQECHKKSLGPPLHASLAMPYSISNWDPIFQGGQEWFPKIFHIPKRLLIPRKEVSWMKYFSAFPPFHSLYWGATKQIRIFLL